MKITNIGSDIENGVTSIHVTDETRDMKDVKFVPEKPYGKWLPYSVFDPRVDGGFCKMCSVCGNILDVMYGCNYCPHCGAPMEVTTLKDILPDFPVKDIMVRTNSPYPTEDDPEGYLDGYVSWDGEKLVSDFILEYSLDDEVAYYEWEDDGSLVCWMHTTWDNGWRRRVSE